MPAHDWKATVANQADQLAGADPVAGGEPIGDTPRRAVFGAWRVIVEVEGPRLAAVVVVDDDGATPVG